MTDFFTLLLDTTPPSVEFGDAGGTNAGDFFQIAYTSDEPLEWATLIDAGGQRLPLAVGDTTLSALLPPTIHDGWATIEWADDVGNEARHAAVVRITSAVVPPPTDVPPKPGGPPRPDKRPIRRRLTARSTIVVSTRARRRVVRLSHVSRQAATVVTRSTRRAELHRQVDLAAVRSHSAIRVRSQWTTASATVASEAAIRRRDDPTIEAFLLDLL